MAPPKLTIQTSNRACNVLALFQCVAAHSETRPAFLNAQIPIFLYPFLNTVNKTRPYEYLRLTALGVIGALVKVDNPDVITFLLNTEIIPLCLRIMERGSELSKTVATFIVQRILLDDSGLQYICNTAERFYAISSVLANMMNNKPSNRLVKHIIRSYARLAENVIVRDILKSNIPPIMRDKNFINDLDESSRKWMKNLQMLLNEKNNMQPLQSSNNHIPAINMNIMGQMIMPQIPMGQISNQPSFMMQQQSNEYGYGMYPGEYINNTPSQGMFPMPNVPLNNKNFTNPYYSFKK